MAACWMNLLSRALHPISLVYVTRSLDKQRVKKPMSLAKIRYQLKEGYYAVTTEAGMRCFQKDLSLIETNCIRFNGVRSFFVVCGCR